jgi:hypothetical protein
MISMEELAAQERQRLAVTAEADRVTDRADAAAAYDRGTRMAAGRLATAAKAPNSLVTLMELHQWTGLSRPTLDKYAAEYAQAAAYDGDDPAKLTNERLAALHLECGPDDRPDIAHEFWRRYPPLAGWHHSAEWLWQTHYNAWWDARGGFDPWSTDEPPALPAYDTIVAEYRRVVWAIADGRGVSN